MIISSDLVICTILISVKAVQLSVHNTLSLSIISHASVSTGAAMAAAAAAAGEVLKDNQHENSVVAAGEQFYPLIVETF